MIIPECMSLLSTAYAFPSCVSVWPEGPYLATLLPSLPCFLNIRMNSSCALRKMSLNSFQLSSAPLSLRAVSQGVPSTNYLSNWKFALWRFMVLTVHFTLPISLKTVNSRRAWSLLHGAATSLDLDVNISQSVSKGLVSLSQSVATEMAAVPSL